MIYTVIASLDKKIIETKRDCRVIRQPLSLLPSEIREYVDSAKNPTARAERELAYTTLLCGLKAFLNLDGVKILRSPDGKPYPADSDIHFSLSHSSGAALACISDEGEVGADLQAEIDGGRAERLKERFFTDFAPTGDSFEINYYFCHIDGGEAALEKICPAPSDGGFTEKWSCAESVMKLHGRGFADASALPRLAAECKTEIRKIRLGGDYYLAISKYR